MTYCEFEGFIEDWVQGLPMDFCLKFLFVVRKKMDADVRVWKSIQVHWGKVLVYFVIFNVVSSFVFCCILIFEPTLHSMTVTVRVLVMKS